jgi:hypothetical protein
VLIGLRTRELLAELLEARCRLSPVVMVIEDLHWIDSVSEEVLSKIVDSEAKLRLLLLTTRRPEYAPPWRDRAVVGKLSLEPLPGGEIRRLTQGRLGVEDLPEALAQQVTDKADGNPLFAEEIVSFLIERGILRATAGKLEFDAGAVAAVLPASVQNLLTARVDRLDAKDRALLQAASVIGRRFDPQLLSGVIGESDEVETRLAAAQALDLVRRNNKSGNYVFKHALVRDALYQSILSEGRTALHLKIADEIERRSGNRLTEVAEILAHHYSQTKRADKAFSYLAMAGTKSLGVYSLDEGAKHFTAALAFLDKNPKCASDDQVAEFLVSYTILLHVSIQFKLMIGVLERYLARIDRLGDDPRAVLIRHQYVFALLWSKHYREAAAMQCELSSMAERLKDSRSRAYALAGEIHVSTIVAPKLLNEFKRLKREAIEAASDTADAYIQNWIRFVIGWDELHRGRMSDGRDSARELMQVGHFLNDPRSTGFGLYLLTWIALVSDSYDEALEYSEQSVMTAVVPFDRAGALQSKGSALVLLRKTKEGVKLLEAQRTRYLADGDLYSSVGTDIMLAIAKVFQGSVRRGLDSLENEVLRNEKEGYRAAADWCRVYLAEVYLQIISGKEKVPLPILLKNLPTLLKVIVTAHSRIRAWMTCVLENPHLDSAGHHIGHAQMILGMLYKAKKKPALAVRHLNEARRILSQFGETPILARLDSALVELGQ